MEFTELATFLANPGGFGAEREADDVADWLAGLDEIAVPMLAENGARPLLETQTDAWRGIANESISLVLGPPGTGKTFILSWMALGYLEAARRRGRNLRVLVTAVTRDAIANLLEAIASKARTYLDESDRPRVAFVGNPPESGLRAGVEQLTDSAVGKALTQPVPLVMGCTVWSLYRLFQKDRLDAKGPDQHHVFDMLCVDEASQLKVPEGLMAMLALRSSGRILAAGDDKQLAPVGVLEEVELEGLKLGGSYYTYLCGSEGPNGSVPVFPLSETFRLNRPLAAFPSTQFYNRQYGPVAWVAENRLRLRTGWSEGLPGWLRGALDPEYPVCVLLYDGATSGTHNPDEASVLAKIVREVARSLVDDEGQTLSSEKLWKEGLAVVTPHRAQNAALRKKIEEWEFGEGCVVETVEKIQGREREVIVAGLHGV